MTRRRAISALVQPSPRSASTSVSRGVSEPTRRHARQRSGSSAFASTVSPDRLKASNANLRAPESLSTTASRSGLRRAARTNACGNSADAVAWMLCRARRRAGPGSRCVREQPAMACARWRSAMPRVLGLTQSRLRRRALPRAHPQPRRARGGVARRTRQPLMPAPRRPPPSDREHGPARCLPDPTEPR